MMKPDLSIILPSYGQKKTILNTIESIFAQKTKLNYEVILVDSTPENLLKYVQNRFPKVKGKWFKKQTRQWEARNIGVEMAKSDKLLFFDTDTVLIQGVLDGIHKSLDKHDIVNCSADNANPENLFSHVIFLTEFTDFLHGRASHIMKSYMAFGVGFNRRVLMDVPFQKMDFSEDLLHGHMLNKKGYEVYLDDKTVVKHINRTNYLDILRNQYRIGKGSALVRKSLDIQGKILVKYPILAFLLPFYREFTIACKLLFTRPSWFILFILLSPLTFIALFSYSLGFFRGAL